MSDLRFEWRHSISDIPREAWDELAGPADTALLEWSWLRAFEISGSMTERTGWLPAHLAAYRGSSLVGVAPLYIKSHSAGEFVFDYAWAEVAEHIGTEYYPKLVGMSPATPAVGYRLLTDPGEPELGRRMLDEVHRFADGHGLRSTAFNFIDGDWAEELMDAGYSPWKHQSYLWTNESFSDFDAYLGRFTKGQRRNIRRERQSVADQGLEVRAFRGSEADPRLFRLMYRYYKATNDQFGMWAARFLNREFFEDLYPDFADKILFVAAYARGRRGADEPVALSFLLAKAGHLIGRYWGSSGFYDSLHFEACYYKPIEWAIDNGYRSFDPGMGSSHKLRRGFRAVSNYSLHRFLDKRMQAVMEANIRRINAMEDARIESMNDHVPFARRGAAELPSAETTDGRSG